MIKYADYTDVTEALGPGKRSCLWVHGCCFNCKNCMSGYTKTGAPNLADADELAEHFADIYDVEGLVISGGEPMLQAAELYKLVCRIREKRKDYPVISYSGFTYEQLLEKSKSDEGIRNYLSVIDILIDGQYVDELNDDTRRFVGSSNQRIINLSNYYSDEYIDKEYNNGERIIEISYGLENKNHIRGIPSREQYEFVNENYIIDRG